MLTEQWQLTEGKVEEPKAADCEPYVARQFAELCKREIADFKPFLERHHLQISKRTANDASQQRLMHTIVAC